MSNSSRLEHARALYRAGRVPEAARMFRDLVQAEPRNVHVHQQLGSLLLDLRQFAEAERHFRIAAELEPRASAARHGLALALRGLGRQSEAEQAGRAAVLADPGNAAAQQLVGNLLKSQRRYSEAMLFLTEATRLEPKDAAAWLNLGVAALELNQLPLSLSAFETALALEPQRPEALNIYGHALLSAGRVVDARRQFEAALHQAPKYAAAHDNLGRLLRALGKPSEAISAFNAAVRCGAGAGTQSNRLYALNFDPGLSPEAVSAQHLQWGAAFPAIPARPVSGPDRPLKVGFVSADLVHHAVAYFFESLLESPPPDWEIHCYFNGASGDAVTERIRSRVARWSSVVDLSDDVLVQRITADKIDILVDLHGHTAQNRLPVFARRPAPVQMTWLGYPNTTGLTAVDYRITDGISDPAGCGVDELHSEKLLRLAGPFLCYRPPIEAPAVSEAPSLKRGSVTFGSFNHSAKLNADVISLWARVLHACPRSRLYLRAHVFKDPGVSDEFRSRFAANGISADRLVLSGDRLSVREHLAEYSEVDVALDPFPYNGTTTTCEALWMGVPVVTLRGHAHAGRVGASLLTHLGRPGWIAVSVDQYVATAVALASQPSQLQAIRAGLRNEFARSPLCSAREFSDSLASAFRQVWVRACAGPLAER